VRLPVSVRDGTVYVKMKVRREAPVA